MCISKTLFNMSSLTTIEKRYGITLRKNENGELKKYKKNGKRYKKVCDIEGCVMSSIDSTYCCNFIRYKKCKMNNTGDLTFNEKKANIIFNNNGNTYKYLKKGNIQQNVCFIIDCLTPVNKNKELYCDDFLSKGKCKIINPFPNTILTEREKEAGIFLKNRKGLILKYNNNQKRICMRPDCLTGIMPKEDYCIRFINSGKCDNYTINTNIELTEREKEAGITLRKNNNGKMKKYKKSGPNWVKVCENENCIMFAKFENDNLFCAKFLANKICDGVDIKCEIELTDKEKKAGIVLRKSSNNEMKKYKLIGNRYIKICENKNCLKIAKSGDIHCYNFINQGICSKDEAGEERVLTEIEEKNGIILQRNRQRELQKYKPRSHDMLVKVCMKQNCLSQVKDKDIYCKRFLTYGWCENVVVNTEATLTEKEEKAGVKLRPNIKGEIKKYMFLHERWVKLCETPNCFNYSYKDTPFCVSDGGLPLCINCEGFHTSNEDGICGYCNPPTPVRRKELLIKKLLDKDFKFKYNRYIKINNGKNKVAPDFLFTNTEYYYIILEVDEYQHSRYTPEEERRREKLIQEALEKPCIFIRFNPDAFKIDGKTTRVTKEKRLHILLSRINYWLKTKPDRQLQTEFLFYNNTENCPENNCNNICECIR